MHRPDDRLISAWLPPEFKEAIQALASVAGVTQSDLLREGLATVALDTASARVDQEQAVEQEQGEA